VNEIWEAEQTVRILLVAKYMLGLADDKGRTHGEKHHLHEVIGMLLTTAIERLGGTQATFTRNIDPNAPSDIPF